MIEYAELPPRAAEPFTTHDQVVAYLFAGHAVLTLESEVSGHHFTYRIAKIPETEIFSVSYLGKDGDYYYIGAVFDKHDFRKTRKTPAIIVPSKQFMAAKYFFDHLAVGNMPPGVKVWHHGKCGACGRVLTDPESIVRGIGPECYKRRLNIAPNDDKRL